MSSANRLFERERAFEQYTKVLTNLATYTIKVGSVDNNFIADRVVEVVTTTDGNNLVITVPNGVYPGQCLLIVLKTLGHDETVTITATTGDSSAMSSAGDYVSLEWIDAVSGWQTAHSQVD